MRQAAIGALLLVAGAVCVVVGVLPVPTLLALADRVVPVLAFVLGLTIVAELAADAGVFDRLADLAARVGRGRTLGLWAAVVVLAVVCTVFLSIDTTAVLLTPIVIALARRVQLPPMPFALTTVWLANTASLLLPVSNLTNLLAVSRIGLAGPPAFAGLMALPALAGSSCRASCCSSCSVTGCAAGTRPRPCADRRTACSSSQPPRSSRPSSWR